MAGGHLKSCDAHQRAREKNSSHPSREARKWARCSLWFQPKTGTAPQKGHCGAITFSFLLDDVPFEMKGTVGQFLFPLVLGRGVVFEFRLSTKSAPFFSWPLDFWGYVGPNVEPPRVPFFHLRSPRMFAHQQLVVLSFPFRFSEIGSWELTWGLNELIHDVDLSGDSLVQIDEPQMFANTTT